MPTPAPCARYQQLYGGFWCFAFAQYQQQLSQLLQMPIYTMLFVSGLTDPEQQAEGLYGNISNWDTSRVTDMGSLFSQAESFNDDISAWNTSAVTVMAGESLTSTGWSTSSLAAGTFQMFAGAESFNGDLSGWDTSGVHLMKGMFNEAIAFDSDISGWDTSKVVLVSNVSRRNIV